MHFYVVQKLASEKFTEGFRWKTEQNWINFNCKEKIFKLHNIMHSKCTFQAKLVFKQNKSSQEQNNLHQSQQRKEEKNLANFNLKSFTYFNENIHFTFSKYLAVIFFYRQTVTTNHIRKLLFILNIQFFSRIFESVKSKSFFFFNWIKKDSNNFVQENSNYIGFIINYGSMMHFWNKLALLRLQAQHNI